MFVAAAASQGNWRQVLYAMQNTDGKPRIPVLHHTAPCSVLIFHSRAAFWPAGPCALPCNLLMWHVCAHYGTQALTAACFTRCTCCLFVLCAGTDDQFTYRITGVFAADTLQHCQMAELLVSSKLI